jgi:acyl-homoserine-lactone acylase
MRAVVSIILAASIAMTGETMYRGLLTLVVGALTGLTFACAPEQPRQAEIIWDEWGVPHVFADDVPSLFYAFGWAQMESHGNLILRLYGESRGRASEYWGETHVDSDRWLHTMGVPERAQQWYQAQSPEFRGYLDAFAAGINAYVQEHGDLIADSVKVVLPVDAVDVLAYVQYGVHITGFAVPGHRRFAEQHLAAGSSAWAIGPSRTEAGHAMLLANPHLFWSGKPRAYEAHLACHGFNMYGVTMVGLPVLAVAFNDDIGWAHTTNVSAPVTFYELALEDGGYRFDGAVRAFEERVDTLRILAGDGTIREEIQRTRFSVHGPVIAEREDAAVAIRAVGFNAPHLLGEWWDMGTARNLSEFETALSRQQTPATSVIYADRDGHILYHFGGLVPVRSEGVFSDWFYTVKRGDTSGTLWTKMHSYAELPRVLDPPSGWLQNTNDPPWTTTFPVVLDPADFPPYMSAPPSFVPRTQRSARMLAEDASITFDELVEYKHSTRLELADLVLDDLTAAVREHGGPLAHRAADVLDAWDRSTDAESRGAVLFTQWMHQVLSTLSTDSSGGGSPFFSTPWSVDEPFTTPDGLADPAGAVRALEEAARKVENDYGALDVMWGDVHRLRWNGIDLPGNGSAGNPWGNFRVANYYQPAEDGRFVAVGGDTYVAAVEFADPVRAGVLLTYGNATQPHSPHVYDQLELFAQKELREAWLTRSEVEAHLESRDTLFWPRPQ